MVHHCYRSVAGSGPNRHGTHGTDATVAVLRILLVVNAFASSVTARNTVVVHRALSQGNDVEVVETNRRGHAIRFAQDAARRGVDIVIGYGGDGTLNEVATGVAGTDTALGVLPGGSTNVFARTLGMPNDPVAGGAASWPTGSLPTTSSPIGLGKVNGRYFCFHTGVGYDAAVVREVERRASMKRWLGPSAVHLRRGAHVDERATTARTALPGRTSTAHDESSTATSRSCSTPTRTRTSATARSTSARRPRSTAVWSRSRSSTMKVGAILGALGGALRGGGVKTSATVDVQTDLSCR